MHTSLDTTLPSPTLLGADIKKIWLLQQTSYSSSLVLHSCPRKYQLDKLRAERETKEQDEIGSVHFAFGHAVGAGIQSAFLPNANIDACYWAAFKAWDFPLLEEEAGAKSRKSFWHALRAIDAAWHLSEALKQEGWELAYFDGKPAIEFSFRVEFPGGFKYRAFIDIILVNSVSGKYKIVEVKTTGATWISEAMYGNSAQALSYGIVLDYLVKDFSSYDVLYLVYKTKTMEWEAMPFTKTRQVKAEWIRNTLNDNRTISQCIEEDYWPKHGESCFEYFKPCQYFGTCGYSDQYLGLDNEDRFNAAIDKELEKKYSVDITLNDLLKHQLLTLEETE